MTGEPVEKRIHIIQGEYRVSSDPSVTFSTLLGSCVAACVRDPVSGVGGMNHFLLPGAAERMAGADAERYGVHLMELLINGLMREGARRDRLKAKLFGGARMMRGLSDIGKKNSDFASNFLKHECIQVENSDVGGERGRRILYSPVSGRARQIYVGTPTGTQFEPRVEPQNIPNTGEFELFVPNFGSPRGSSS